LYLATQNDGAKDWRGSNIFTLLPGITERKTGLASQGLIAMDAAFAQEILSNHSLVNGETRHG